MGQTLSLPFKSLSLDITLIDILFYFRVRSACKVYKVPWGPELKDYPILSWLQSAPSRLVSYIYEKVHRHILYVHVRDESSGEGNIHCRTNFELGNDLEERL